MRSGLTPVPLVLAYFRENIVSYTADNKTNKSYISACEYFI